jgi:hypothetical protein
MLDAGADYEKPIRRAQRAHASTPTSAPRFRRDHCAADSLKVTAFRGEAPYGGEFIASPQAIASPVFDRRGVAIGSLGPSARISRKALHRMRHGGEAIGFVVVIAPRPP